MQWNDCVHILDLGLYSHPNEFFGTGVRTHVNFKRKNPSTPKQFSSEEDQIHNTVSSRTASPTYHQLSYSGPANITDDKNPYATQMYPKQFKTAYLSS